MGHNRSSKVELKGSPRRAAPPAASPSPGGAATATMWVAAAHLHSLGVGALMGAIHALTGPDHMSALITIAVNGGCAHAQLPAAPNCGPVLPSPFHPAAGLLCGSESAGVSVTRSDFSW